MSNSEYIKNLNNLELCDYLYSVYLAGKLSAKMDCEHKNYKTTDLFQWLGSERTINEKK